MEKRPRRTDRWPMANGSREGLPCGRHPPAEQPPLAKGWWRALVVMVGTLLIAFVLLWLIAQGCAAQVEPRAFSPAQEMAGVVEGVANTQTQTQTTWNTDRYMLTAFMVFWLLDRVLKYVGMCKGAKP